MEDFLGRVEAFLLNVDGQELTLELMGKFESFLQQDYQKVAMGLHMDSSSSLC